MWRRVRRPLEALDLPFHPDSLTFHESRRDARTASLTIAAAHLPFQCGAPIGIAYGRALLLDGLEIRQLRCQPPVWYPSPTREKLQHLGCGGPVHMVTPVERFGIPRSRCAARRSGIGSCFGGMLNTSATTP